MCLHNDFQSAIITIFPIRGVKYHALRPSKYCGEIEDMLVSASEPKSLRVYVSSKVAISAECF